MAVEIIMPKQGNTVENCLIEEWRVQVGDTVKKGDIICVIETDKASLELEAEEEGTVLALLYKEGDDVPVLQPILVLGNEGEEIPTRPNDPKAAPPPPQAPPPSPVASPPAPAPPPPPAAAPPSVTSPAPASAAPAPPQGRPASSPRARKSAETYAVDLNALRGSGPGGRILEEDVRAFAEQRGNLSSAARDAVKEYASTGSPVEYMGAESSASGQAGAGQAGAGQDREQELSGIRKIIAQRMMESLQGTAQYTLHSSASAESIQKWRKLYKESDESLGLKGIGIGDMLLFALSRVLPRYPQINAEYKNGKVYSYSHVHLGYAVDTPRGLMVPVLKNAEQKSLKQISAEAKHLAQACVSGNIQPEDLSGATFTVSNLGAYGIERFTPVINPPQVAVLGLCSITPQAVQKEGQIIFEPRIGLSMTVDHQIVDGAPAARFLKDFATSLSSFELLAAL